MKTEIKTDRLLLRRFRAADYDDLFEFLSQLEDDEFEGYPGITYENGKEHFKSRLDSDDFYAIELISSGKVIGISIAEPGILPRKKSAISSTKTIKDKVTQAKFFAQSSATCFGKVYTGSMPNAIRGILPRGSCWKASASGARHISGRISFSVKTLTVHRSGRIPISMQPWKAMKEEKLSSRKIEFNNTVIRIHDRFGNILEKLQLAKQFCGESLCRCCTF